METEETAVVTQEVSEQKPTYFWNKISFETIKKGITVLAVMLACLPVFVSLTVKPWIYMLRGEEGVINCYYLIVGQYWYALVYMVIAVTSICMVLGALQKYRISSLHGICNKKWIFNHWLSINMLLLLLWSLISTCFAKDKQSAVWGDYYCHEGILLYFFYGTLFLSGSWLNRKQMKLAAEVLAGICAVTGFLVLLASTSAEYVFYLEDNQSAMFHNSNHYGYYLTICAVLVIGLALQDSGLSRIMRLGRWLEIWLIFNALILCNTTGCFLAVIMTLIFWNLYICILKKDLKKKIFTMDIFILMIILVLNTAPIEVNHIKIILSELLNLYESADTTEALDKMGSSRGILWKWGIEFSFKKPIFGYGPGNLQEPYGAVESFTSSPHNDLILILVSMGYPALIFYISGLTAHLIGFFRYVKTMSVFDVTMYASVAAYLMSSFFGVSMYYTAPYYFLLLGFSYGIYKSHCRESSALPVTPEEPEYLEI